LKFDLGVVELTSHIAELSRVHNSIKQAGLVDSLASAKAVTFFAPDNEAFDKLQSGTIIGALEDPGKLETMLTYHVVPQKLMAANLRKLKSVTSLQGGTLTIEEHRLRHGIKVNGAVVKEADIEGTNGVIHIIDTVLMP